MRTAVVIIGIAALVCNLLAFVLSAQQAPGPSSSKPVVPAPQGRTLSTNAPPTALLDSPHSIKVAPGVVVTVTSTNKFSIGQMRQWLREAARGPIR